MLDDYLEESVPIAQSIPDRWHAFHEKLGVFRHYFESLLPGLPVRALRLLAPRSGVIRSLCHRDVWVVHSNTCLLLLDNIKDASHIDQAVAKGRSSLEHFLAGLHLLLRKHLVELIQVIILLRLLNILVVLV